MYRILCAFYMLLLFNVAMASEYVASVDYPVQFEDLSFREQMEYKAQGYQPWRCRVENGQYVGCTYIPITIKQQEKKNIPDSKPPKYYRCPAMRPGFYSRTNSKDSVRLIADVTPGEVEINGKKISYNESGYLTGGAVSIEDIISESELSFYDGLRPDLLLNRSHGVVGLDAVVYSPAGTKIYSMCHGRVENIFYNTEYGNCISILCDSGENVILYCRLDGVGPQIGDMVYLGCMIGVSKDHVYYMSHNFVREDGSNIVQESHGIVCGKDNMIPGRVSGNDQYTEDPADFVPLVGADNRGVAAGEVKPDAGVAASVSVNNYDVKYQYVTEYIVEEGKDVYSAQYGTVLRVDDIGGKKCVYIGGDIDKSGERIYYVTYYCRLSQTPAKVGDVVKKGCKIGKTGDNNLLYGRGKDRVPL